MTLNQKSPSIFSGSRWLVTALGIVVAVVLLGSFVSRRDDSVPVRAAVVQRGTIRSVVSTNGKVEPLRSLEAHGPLATTVKRVLVSEGDHVKKGQLLLQLDDGDVRTQSARATAQLKSAQSSVNAIQHGGSQEEVLTVETQLVKARNDRDSAARNLDALRHLQQKGAASGGEVKDAEAKLQSAEADLQLLQQKQKDRYSKPEIAKVDAERSEAEAAYNAAQDVLQKSNVRAPFDGIVYSLPVRQGVYVQPGDLLLQEADLSKVLVRAYVDEPDLGRLAPGQKIEVTWDAVPGRVWYGSVSGVPSTVKLHGTRNVGETTCIVDNKDLKLLPNVTVGVTIVSREDHMVLTAPRETVRLDDSKPYVFQIINNEVHRRDVETSVSNLTDVEITKGIPENAVVAVGSINAKPLRDGLSVRVVH
ncbi:MAG: efflux transporter periplasmic adaptor subunit [Acidobacteria bacterium]|nr:MAG: efflux transporter periplasmic adaptor subunit [Acidobacteriota bacterium]